jgi:glutamyl-tRNA reductase
MHTAVIGTDFNRTSLSMRDAVFFDADKVIRFLTDLPAAAPIAEIVILSTCNRVEIYYTCTGHEQALAWLKQHFALFHDLPVATLDRVMYTHRCEQAVRHLFRVAAGLESMVIGEDEILGQIRQAYGRSRQIHRTGAFLNKLFQASICVGRRVRHRTAISQGSSSVSSLAIDQLLQHYGRLDDKAILVVGAGTMSLRLIKRLAGMGHRQLFLANRTLQRSQRVAQAHAVQLLPYDQLRRHTGAFDIIILATAAPHPILHGADLQASDHGGRELCIVDLGAPRNAAADIAGLPGVRLITVDDLLALSRKALEERAEAIETAERIVEQEVREFARWYFHRQAVCPKP